jgi:transcriptional regulator of heat shock response
MLTERQIELLNAIISEHMESAEPVGSVEVVAKYNFKCSPATIRNEMAKLINMGYLEMFHTSSGRIPTKLAYKLYLEEILEEMEIPVLQEVAMKQRLWGSRTDNYKLLRDAVQSLAETIGTMAIATTDEGFIISSGASYLLDNKEFEDINTIKTALTVIDSFELLNQIFKKSVFGEDIRYVIGDEIGIQNLERSAFVFSEYKAGNKKGYISIFGPSRMHYNNVVPSLKYTKKLVEELAENW